MAQRSNRYPFEEMRAGLGHSTKRLVAALGETLKFTSRCVTWYVDVLRGRYRPQQSPISSHIGLPLAEKDNPDLAMDVAGLSLGARLDQAIERGSVIRYADGRLGLSDTANASNGEATEISPYSTKNFGLPCTFLNTFLFQNVYAETTVPFGCRECYKIKIVSGTLRELMAVKEIAESTGLTTKSGAEADMPTNPDRYGTYLYFRGLDQARRAYKSLRQTIDQQQRLGPRIEMKIKRGCSNYERKCGPSDQYKFDPHLELAEASLFRRFVRNPPTNSRQKELQSMWLLKMIATAYRIGDESYRDFTNDKPLLRPDLNYSPEDEPPKTDRLG
jgi:hypothetical protein